MALSACQKNRENGSNLSLLLRGIAHQDVARRYITGIEIVAFRSAVS